MAEQNITSRGSTDEQMIKQKVLAYIEAWYHGDAERGITSLHPELAKRIVRFQSESGQPYLDEMGADSLADRWRSGDGKATPENKRQKTITLLDIFGNMASVRLETSSWVDYMHLAKINDDWVIVNILWKLKD